MNSCETYYYWLLQLILLIFNLSKLTLNNKQKPSKPMSLKRDVPLTKTSREIRKKKWKKYAVQMLIKEL